MLLKDRIATRCNRPCTDPGRVTGTLVGQPTRLVRGRGGVPANRRQAYADIWQAHHRRELLMRRHTAAGLDASRDHAIDASDPARGSVWVIDDISAERGCAGAAPDQRDCAGCSGGTGRHRPCQRRAFAHINRRFTELLGYQREEVPTLADWWPRAYPDPAYRAWVVQTWQAGDRAGAPGRRPGRAPGIPRPLQERPGSSTC